MHEIQEREGKVHWTSIKSEATVHNFVTLLEHKVNTQLLM